VLISLVAIAGCVNEPQTSADKEVFVEPFREPEYELARLGKVVPFPIQSSEQPRAYSLVRALDGDDERLRHTQQVLAETKDDGTEGPPVDPTKLEKPPTSLVFPDRIDVRQASACYLGHCLFFDRAGTSLIHHFTLLVVNRERTRLSVPVSSFVALGDLRDGNGPAPLEPLVAATDRAIKLPALMEVPPGEQRRAHFFYREKARVSPILTVRWAATVEDGRGGSAREVSFRGDLVRRYMTRGAPLSGLEDRVARGMLDFPEPIGTASDWTDPGLSAVPGSGK
jgi:hypothetical protein